VHDSQPKVTPTAGENAQMGVSAIGREKEIEGGEESPSRAYPA